MLGPCFPTRPAFRRTRAAVSQGQVFGKVMPRWHFPGGCQPGATERTYVRRCSRAALAKTDARTHVSSIYRLRTHTHARTYARAYVYVSASARARASVRPCARLAVTDGDRGACSVCQSVQRVLGHFVDHALGRPTAVGGDRCGARDAGGGQRCWRARSVEVILTCAVACDW